MLDILLERWQTGKGKLTLDDPLPVQTRVTPRCGRFFARRGTEFPSEPRGV